MVHELNLRYVPAPDVEILLDDGSIVSLDAYIASAVQPPAYFVGDSVQPGAFSVRYPDPALRQDAIDFVTAVKPYLLAGVAKVHLCRHDEGLPCDAPEVVDSWGGMTENE